MDYWSAVRNEFSHLPKKTHSENCCLLTNRRFFARLTPGQVAPLDEKEM